IGPILCMYFMTRQVKPKFPPKAQHFHMGEIALGSAADGRLLSEFSKALPTGVQVTMVRIGNVNLVPKNDLILAEGSALLVVADSEQGLAEAAARFGKLEPGSLVKDRSALDYIRVFVS